MYDAVASVNIGAKSIIKLLEAVGVEPGKYATIGCRLLNKRHLLNAKKQNSAETNQRRRTLQGLKKNREDRYEEKEGQTYGAGSC